MSDSNRPSPFRCIHLTCKSMIVCGEEFEDDADFQSGLEDFECARTQSCTGPDNGDLSLELCSNRQRQCFQEY